MRGQHRVSKRAFKKSAWTPKEDMQLVNYINRFGIWNWCQMPKFAGLSRSGKSCRLRWKNYLNPDIKRGNYSPEEDEKIINMRLMEAGWSAIAEKLPGRTDNEIKNRWHTHLKKRLNNNPIGNMESQIGTILDCDYSNFISHAPPKASKPELAYAEIPISSYMFNNIGSDILNNPPTLGDYERQKTEVLSIDSFGTIEDPHVNFWRKPFSLENAYMEDDHDAANYVEYPGLLSTPQDWYKDPMNPYNYCPDSCDYWFKLLTITGDLDEMVDVYY